MVLYVLWWKYKNKEYKSLFVSVCFLSAERINTEAAVYVSLMQDVLHYAFIHITCEGKKKQNPLNNGCTVIFKE